MGAGAGDQPVEAAGMNDEAAGSRKLWADGGKCAGGAARKAATRNDEREKDEWNALEARRVMKSIA